MLICLATESETVFAGEIEVDESYFGGHRKGKRGRGAAGKVPVRHPQKGRQGVHQSHYRHKSKNIDGYYAKTD